MDDLARHTSAADAVHLHAPGRTCATPAPPLAMSMEPEDLWLSMGRALAPSDHLEAEAAAAAAVNVPPLERPAPPSNVFYRDARYRFEAPVEPEVPRCTCGAKCAYGNGIATGGGDLAVYLCYSCKKFDPAGKGYHCAACFKARHPWYRVEHKFVRISAAEEIESELSGQVVRAEVDRQLFEVADTIAKVRAVSAAVAKESADTKGDDLIKEGARRALGSELVVKRLRRFVRHSANGGEGAALVASSEGGDPAAQAHGATDLATALLMQSFARRWLARRRVNALLVSTFTRILDPDTQRYYYLDSRDGSVSWVPPRLLGDDAGAACLPTPRGAQLRLGDG